jgi:hypothetical protein
MLTLPREVKNYLFLRHNVSIIDLNLERFETFTFIDKIISSDASPGFDYATSNSYTLSIECTDGQYTDSDIFIVSLVKNAEPIFLNLQSNFFYVYVSVHPNCSTEEGDQALFGLINILFITSRLFVRTRFYEVL